jgi:beta-lactam-binding protein with PASTA domain
MADSADTPTRRGLWPVTVKGRDRLRITLILLGAALGGYLVTCVAYPAPLITRDHAVARVLGLPLATAQKELEDQGLKVKVEGDEADPVVPAGHVTWQDPPAETVLPNGSLVHLTTSSGPEPIPVPDVISFELDQARQVVEAAGLRLGALDSIASSVEEGIVVATRPATGTTRPPGAAVDLVLSKGPADIRVPDVVGLRQEDARHRLEAAGLRVGIVSTRTGRPGSAGTVLEQRPTSGVFSPHEGRINLIIGN